MNWKNVAKRTEGTHTASSLARTLNITSQTAVNYIYGMRERGFVTTSRGERGKRLYLVSPVQLRKVGNKGFYNLLNEYSTLKIQQPFEDVVVGVELGPEDVIARALLTRDYRVILACIPVFRRVSDWKKLYRLSKEQKSERAVAALYLLARKCFRVPRMDGRVFMAMKGLAGKKMFIIEGMRSRDFEKIEEECGVFIPFNKSDLSRLRRGNAGI